MKKIVLILFFLISISLASAQIIFEDNFDGYSDWISSTNVGCNIYPSTKESIFGAPPLRTTAMKGAICYRSNSEDYSGTNPLFTLDSINARSGKSIKLWEENRYHPTGGGIDWWIGDQGTDEPSQAASNPREAYYRWYQRWQPNYQCTKSSGAVNKMARIHTDVAPDYDDVAPSSTWKISQVAYRQVQITPILHCTPSGDNMYFKTEFQIGTSKVTCPNNIPGNPLSSCLFTAKTSSSANFKTLIQSSSWIPMQIHVKLNDHGQSNGVFEMWINNNDQNNPDISHLGWEYDDSSVHGLHLTMPDNTQNAWNCNAGTDCCHTTNPSCAYPYYPYPDEQWISYDDLVISTSFIDNNYVIGNGNYTDTTPPITTASPSSGTYSSSQSVTLSRNEAGTTYYTTDGSTPTISSTTYSSPIPISQNTTINFFSVDTSNNIEAVKSEVYVIDTTATPQGNCTDIDLLYHLDSSQAFDSSGKGNDGTVNGATYISSGKYSGAFSFDGNDEVTVNNPISTGSDATISFWINAPSGSGYVADGGYFVHISGGKLKFYPGQGSWTPLTSSTIADNTWHHVAIVQSGTNSKIFVDGNNEVDSTIASLSASSNLIIGARGAGNYLTGIIDDFAVYNRALSQSEVDAIATSTSPISCGSIPQPACNDGICNGAENCQTCPQDCPIGLSEVCCSGIIHAGDCCSDTNCISPDVCTYYSCTAPITCTDNDNDTYSIEGSSCGAVDCDDTNTSIHPNAQEICDNGVDDDCDGQTDENDTECQATPQGIIFEDNFDEYGDWSSDTNYNVYENWPATMQTVLGGPGSTLIKGWHSYRVPQNGGNSVGRPMYVVDNTEYHGLSGKSLQYNIENSGYINGGGMNLWIGDKGTDYSSQSKSGYDELYIRTYMKFEDDFDLEDGGEPFIKFFRLYTGVAPDYDDESPSSTYATQADRDALPYHIKRSMNCYFDLDKDGNDDERLKFAYALGQYQTGNTTDDGINYVEVKTTIPASSFNFKDYRGQWLYVEWYIKLNSVVNNVSQANGEMKLWITPESNIANINQNNPSVQWTGLKIRSTNDRKFNLIIAQDNVWGQFEGPLDEHTLSYDDLVVSTSFVGPNYIPSGGTNHTCDSDDDNLLSNNATCNGNDCDDSDPNILQCHPADTSIPYNCVDDTELTTFIAAWKAKGTAITMPVLMSAIKIWKGCN